jgi:hypothetical protein
LKQKGSQYNGAIVPSGTLNCNGCVISGHNAIVAFTVPNASAPPTVSLGGQFGQGVLGGNGTGIITDGTAQVIVTNQTFRSAVHAYDDSLPAPSSQPTSSSSSSGSSGGSVDFGYAPSGTGSTGGNLLNSITRTDGSEIFVTKPGVTVYALNNIWLQNVQGANSSGLFGLKHRFGPGAHATPTPAASNVQILKTATGSLVFVGPVPTPTTAPTSQPSSQPSASPSPTPTP